MFTSEIGGIIANTSVSNFSLKLGKTVNNIHQNTPHELPQRLWFEVPVGIKSFCGRKEFLGQLHETLQQNKSETSVTILSQLKVVSGSGGVGKTQTAIRYIYQFGNFYDHVIWIEAETEMTLRSSFMKLAEEIKLPVQNSEGQIEDLVKSLKKIYNALCEGQKSTLFVFDNADDFKNGIGRFLPSTVDPKQKNLVILVTSRNQHWSRTNEKFQVLPLDVFSYEESLNFIIQQLDIPDSPEVREETREFIELMGGLPLALQQSVAYIKEKKSQVGQRYKILDYIKDFYSATDTNILEYNKIPGSQSTIFVTWNVTFEKIKTLNNGKSAIEIIEALALLYADKIPVNFIQSLFPQLNELEISLCLTLLERYSLIKLEFQENDEKSVSIHRQLQFVIIQNLKSCKNVKHSFGKVLERFYNIFKRNDSVKNLESVFDSVLERCAVLLKTINLAKSADILLNIYQLVENPFKCISGNSEKYLDFMQNFAYILNNAGRYSESLTLCTNISNNLEKLLGENHPRILNMRRFQAALYNEMGQYDEALDLCQDVLEKTKNFIGPQHPTTLQAKHEVARILSRQEKFTESLRLLEELLLQQKTNRLGENYLDTLDTQELLALVKGRQGEAETALKLYDAVEKKRIHLFGADHHSTLQTMNNKGWLLLKLGRVKEASPLLYRAYEKQKEILGDDNPSTIATLDSIAGLLEKEGKFVEALELHGQLLERRKIVFGEDHPETKDTERNIELLLEKMKNLQAD